MILNKPGVLRAGFGKKSSRQQAASSAVVYTPPGLPLHWFDFTDKGVLFQDVEAASPVTATGQTVLRINNQGSSTEFVSVASEGPVYTTEVLLPNNVGAATSFTTTTHLKSEIDDVPTAGVESVTHALVVANADVETFATPQSWDDFTLTWAMSGSDYFIHYVDNESNTGTGSIIVNDVTYAVLATNDEGGTPETRMHQSFTEAVVDKSHQLLVGPAAETKMSFGEQSASEGNFWQGQILEYIVWNGALSVAEVDLYKVYTNEKYGIVWV